MLPALRAYIRLITTLNRWCFMLAAALMLIIVPVMLFEVTSRYVFNAPTAWGMELAVLLFGPYFLLGGPYLMHIGGHVNLDIVRRRLSPVPGRILDSVNFLVIILFCGILLYYSWPLALQSFEYRETTFSGWNPPLWPYKFAVPLAAVLLGLQTLAEFIRIWIDPVTRTEEELA
ncbi:MAG TPA: TRAP transporter small permease subunit [Alcaligenes sp.]|nr:TRAP transporter small permease subunit [Alcaligenes sp.]HRL27494.1 TRAP transporter small permease subunit [Alcaligenes sp.]